jgi:hypothetical protein
MVSLDELTRDRLRNAHIQIVLARLDRNDVAVFIWSKFIMDLSEVCKNLPSKDVKYGRKSKGSLISNGIEFFTRDEKFNVLKRARRS